MTSTLRSWYELHEASAHMLIWGQPIPVELNPYDRVWRTIIAMTVCTTLSNEVSGTQYAQRRKVHFKFKTRVKCMDDHYCC
jgi:hypothetical protein